MYSARVLGLLALFLEMVNSFSWDIVVGEGRRLDFYYNGTLTHSEDNPSDNIISSVAYDPVHYRVLFADYYNLNVTISSFDLSTRKIQTLVTRKSKRNYARVVYDPVTQLLFWRDYDSIYSFSLNPALSNKAVDVNRIVTLDRYPHDIAVESCGGYIYWVTNYNIERARFDGSEREVLIDSHVHNRRSLAIDQQTQKMYWTETKYYVNGNYHLSIETANFNGKNRTTLHTFITDVITLRSSLTVTKDFIYWMNNNQIGIWQLPKIPSKHVKGKLFSKSSSNCVYCQHIAVNYTIQEQIQGSKSCEALKNLIPNNSNSSIVSICQNYCFQGNCSVSAEGQPTCSCKTGYSGERCEVNACHKHCLNNGVCSLNKEHEPVCQCTEGYDGERCDVSICKDYCLQGNCSVGTEGQPKCSCKAGYSGERCNVPAFLIKCIQTVSKLKDMLNTAPVTLGKGVKTTCADV